MALPDYAGAGVGTTVLGSAAPSIPLFGTTVWPTERVLMVQQAHSSRTGHWAMFLPLLFLIGSLLSVSALAAGPGTWDGGRQAPSPSGTRPADLDFDPPLTLPPATGAGSARVPVLKNPEPATASGAPGAGAPGEAFRFRGDKTLQQAPGVESSSAPGYRFRPLTPAEQERSEEQVGWRPLGRDGHRSQAPARDVQSEDDAYGYHSDSWFRKYYGERP